MDFLKDFLILMKQNEYNFKGKCHLYYFHAEYIVLREMSLLHPEVSKQEGCR